MANAPSGGDGNGSPGSLVDRWRNRAIEYRGLALESIARAVERSADELEQALREEAGVTLTLREASEASGYSVDHLGRLVREGRLPNAGRLNAPRIRREDVPRRAGRIAPPTVAKYDPVADARSLRSRRGGQ
jgi:acyl-CoA reductase-like NAD-dependent aldehyde dehydrogenase